MRRFASILILLVSFSLLRFSPANAAFFEGNSLLTIDGINYTGDDYLRWWKFWNEEKGAVPKNIDPYIDWLLLSREGERMDLGSGPGYKRQTQIFLQTRTLLLLKNEAVDSKIKVGDEEIKKRYEERFLPRMLVQRLDFKDEKTAMAAWNELAAKKVTVKELQARKPEKGGPDTTSENWVRPKEIDKGWAAIFRKMKPGTVVDPKEHKKGKTLYFLKDQKGGDAEDLAKVRDIIHGDLWREQETLLTKALIKELRNKYQVKVDDKRIAALDINAPDKSFTDTPVITTTRKNFSEKEFMAVVRRLIATRPPLAHAGADKELEKAVKADCVSNLVVQNVTNWGALDRHYEEKEPLKWEYDFNLKHRLGVMLEERLFYAEAKVTDDEIKQHYEKNKSLYTQPALAKLYIVDETQGPIEKIWADAASGQKFDQVMLKYAGTEVAPQEAPVNHLDPEVKAVVDKLTKGETSQIFKAQGIKVIVNLVEKTPEAPLPLDRVKDNIRTRLLKEKVAKLRSDYLGKLKGQVKIEVRQGPWKDILQKIETANKKELEEDKKQKELAVAKQKELAAAKRKELEEAKQKELGGK